LVDSSVVVLLAQGPGGGNGQGDFMKLMMFLGIMVLALWFIILRPQKRDQQAREKLINGLQKGDRVITAGGIHGTVANASDKDTVEVEVARNIKLTFNRGSISVINPKKSGGEGDTKST
jgi:preprotein translocase subunit YajC